MGPEHAAVQHRKVTPAPKDWSILYSPDYTGQITVPNNPIQIADAALYLSKTKPSLGITDPYELNKNQFDATIDSAEAAEAAGQDVLELCG